MLSIDLAGISIGIDNRYPAIDVLAEGYKTEKPPSFTVAVSDEDMKYERERSEFDLEDKYIETVALYRKIGERLPEFDAFVFHGAVLEMDGKALIFTAKSGVGKTTHIRLWKKEFGSRVSVLNGDKPVIRIIDGVPYAAGTPWRGKEGFGKPGTLPIGAIYFVGRGEKNRARSIGTDEALLRFATQAYIPRGNKLAASLALSCLNRVISSVPLIELSCNMDPEAAHTALAALEEVYK